MTPIDPAPLVDCASRKIKKSLSTKGAGLTPIDTF